MHPDDIYPLQIVAHMPEGARIFKHSDLLRELTNVIQDVLQQRAIAYRYLNAQEAYEAFSVTPGEPPQTKVKIKLNSIEVRWTKDYTTNAESFFPSKDTDRDRLMQDENLTRAEANERIHQNHLRKVAWYKDEWHYLRVQAVAIVAPETEHNWLNHAQEITSSSYAGIASDSPEAHFLQWAQVELMELQDTLPYYNIDVSDWDAHVPPEAHRLPNG